MIAAACAAIFACQFAHARPHSFIKIADDNNPRGLSIFVSHPSVNHAGTVAFFSFVGGGGHGIFRGNGGGLLTIADSTMLDDETKGIIPVIGDDGVVIFAATLDSGVGGIFAGTGGAQLQTIIDDSSKFQVFSNPARNQAGDVAFCCVLDTGPLNNRIYRLSRGELTPIADEDGQFCCVGHYPAINNAGAVAFTAFMSDASVSGVFVNDGQTITTIATSQGPLGLIGLDRAASINDAGVVAFHAKLDGGGEGIFIGDGSGSAAPLATSAGPFGAFGDPAINAAGLVAFRAALDGGGAGIFTGPAPDADCVIRTGDRLFGSTVTNVQFYRGLGDAGHIAFEYQLASGVRGVALAAPALEGDITGDGQVDIDDLLAVINAWGACPPPPRACEADVTGDGQVDVDDLLAVINNWS